MSSRAFAFRLAAALLFIGLAFAAAPASAQYYYSGCGGCGISYVVPQPRYYYPSSCGGCGTAYVVPQPRYYVAPLPRYHYAGSCGACGTATYYVVQPPVVQQQYYVAPAVGAYETAVETEVVEPEFEQSPAYYEGQRIHRRAAVDYRINRRFDRRIERRIERRMDRRVERRVDRRGERRLRARY